MRNAYSCSVLLLFLALPALATGPPALGTGEQPGEASAGGLLLETPDGYRSAPTLATDVDIVVTGLIARTRVTQRFSNPTKEWVEGIYVFPLPERSAVDSLEMRVGARRIEGRVEERARARATYQKAKEEGRKASLVEQERPNIFTTSIANLGPDEEVEVTITYQEDVHYDSGRFELRFPMVVAPRYIPGEARIEGFAGTGWSSNTSRVPDAARITPPVAPPVAPPEAGQSHPVRIRARLDAGFPLDQIESSSHPILVSAKPDHVYEIRLDDRETPANADFLLAWQPIVGASPAAALFHERWQGEDYALLMVLPPPPQVAQARLVSREIIIVIDTSGSMGGESIVQARRAVDFALGTLRPGDAFNVIRFDSRHQSLFEDSRPATLAALAEARHFVGALEAGGGTEMQPALEAALEPGRESRAVRQVIFVTDGAVGNEAELFALIGRKLDRSRLYTVGIGSAPNSHFMKKAAESGRGTFTYIGRPEEVGAKMAALFSKLESPVLHDLSLEWDAAGAESWPARIPDVYVGEPVVVAARLPQGALRARFRGERDGEEIEVELPLEGGSDHQGVARLWARRKVAALMDSLDEGASIDRVSVEVAALGVKHQLVTRWSSLVAVDVTPTAPIDVEPSTRAIPSLLPKGWDFLGLFRPARPAPSSPTASTVDQRLAQVSIGRLPQGATPAALLVAIGLACWVAATLVWILGERAVGPR